MYLFTEEIVTLQQIMDFFIHTQLEERNGTFI